jgi:hypothetical protein
MPSYKVIYKEFHQLTISNIQSFDTDDQDAWEIFRKDAIQNYDVDADDYPEKAPSDPEIWFDLIAKLDTSQYDDKEENYWTMDKGGYETAFELEDEEGNTLKSW